MNGVIWSGRISLRIGRVSRLRQGSHRWLSQADYAELVRAEREPQADHAEQDDEPGQEAAPGQDEGGHGCRGGADPDEVGRWAEAAACSRRGGRSRWRTAP